MSMRRNLLALSALLFCIGLACLSQAQVPMTGAGKGAPGAASYTAQGVHFDGSTYTTRGAALTGGTSSKVGIISFWLLESTGPGGNFDIILEDVTFGNTDGVQIVRLLDGTLQLSGNNHTTFNIITTTVFTNDSMWRHVLLAWDGLASVIQLYINDVTESSGSTANSALNYGASTDWGMGARVVGGTLPLTGDIADFYFNSTQTLDLSVTANRRKFITAGGAPVNLGSDGSTPTGTAPIMFFSGAVGSWQTNKGSGGGFSVTAGALSAASTNPP